MAFLSQEQNEERRVQYVKDLYTQNLFAEFYKPGTRDIIGYYATPVGLTIYDGHYPSRTAEDFFDWSFATHLITSLIHDGDYLKDTEPETQLDLFGAPEPAPEKDQPVILPVVTDNRQLAVSQEVIDACLRLGGCTKGSAARIYGYYRRANDVNENILFLRRE